MQNTQQIIAEAIECTLEYIDDKNYIPTNKQLAEALHISENTAEKLKENAEYAEFIKLREGYTRFAQEIKDGFGGFRNFHKLFLEQKNK